ncbi:hypothetical protein CGRA01v4_10387 [Colletotrichum graminicola]|nr:hypothetical protein CGRA01v4_10387 [Colletotrichum graminicola]
MLLPRKTTVTRPPSSTLASAPPTAPPPVLSTTSRLCPPSSATRHSKIASPPTLATRTARTTAPRPSGLSVAPSTPRLTKHLVPPPRPRLRPPKLPVQLAPPMLAPPRPPALPSRPRGLPRLPTLPATATLLPLLPLVSSPTCSERSAIPNMGLPKIAIGSCGDMRSHRRIEERPFTSLYSPSLLPDPACLPRGSNYLTRNTWNHAMETMDIPNRWYLEVGGVSAL